MGDPRIAFRGVAEQLGALAGQRIDMPETEVQLLVIQGLDLVQRAYPRQVDHRDGESPEAFLAQPVTDEHRQATGDGPPASGKFEGFGKGQALVLHGGHGIDTALRIPQQITTQLADAGRIRPDMADNATSCQGENARAGEVAAELLTEQLELVNGAVGNLHQGT